jgi:hypothetical protein
LPAKKFRQLWVRWRWWRQSFATSRGHFIYVMPRGGVVTASGISGDVTTPGLLTRGVVRVATAWQY